MFAKFLIFVLLGTSFVLATPFANENVEVQTEVKSDAPFQSWGDKLYGWWNSVKSSVSEYYHKFKKTFEETYEGIVGKGSQLLEYGKDKYNQLAAKYNELQSSALKAISDEKDKWEQKLKDAYSSGRGEYEKVKKQADEAIESLERAWNKKLEDLKVEIQQAEEEAKKEAEAKRAQNVDVNVQA